MAKLKAQLDTLDGLADALKEFYVENDDGTFTLDLEGGENVTGLKTALQKERKNVKDLTSELTGFKKLGETPDDIQATIDQAGETAGDGEKVTETREYVLLKQKHDQAVTENETLKGTVDTTRKASQRVIRTSALTQALAQAKATSSGIKLLTNELSGRIQVEIGDDGSSNITVFQADGETPMVGTGADGAATVPDLVKEVGMKEFPELFNGTGVGGSGKPPGAGGGKGGKSMSRAEFDALTPQRQGEIGAEAAAGEITITD